MGSELTHQFRNTQQRRMAGNENDLLPLAQQQPGSVGNSELVDEFPPQLTALSGMNTRDEAENTGIRLLSCPEPRHVLYLHNRVV